MVRHCYVSVVHLSVILTAWLTMVGSFSSGYFKSNYIHYWPQLSPVSAIPLNLGCLQKSLVVCWLFVISIWRCSLWWRPCGARGRCRISPPRFLAECRKRRLNQGSFVMFSCLFSLICIVCMRVHVCVFLWFILSFFPYCVFVSNSQVVGLFYIAIVYLCCFVFLVFASTSACDCLACLVWLVSKMTYCVSSET